MARGQVIVHNWHKELQYSGPWATTAGENKYARPQERLESQYRITNGTGSLEYAFNGTTFSVAYSLSNADTRNISVHCAVDNIILEVDLVNIKPNANGSLCSARNLLSGLHHVFLTVSVPQGNAFWFDHLTHDALSTVNSLSPRAPLRSLVVPLDNMAGAAGWAEFGGSGSGAYWTSRPGATFTTHFTGHALMWYGFYDPSFPWPQGGRTPVAFYSIDQNAPVAFDTKPPAVASKPQYQLLNQLLFQVGNLAEGTHMLEITFTGDTRNDIPLTAFQVMSLSGGDDLNPPPAPASSTQKSPSRSPSPSIPSSTIATDSSSAIGHSSSHTITSTPTPTSSSSGSVFPSQQPITPGVIPSNSMSGSVSVSAPLSTPSGIDAVLGTQNPSTIPGVNSPKSKSNIGAIVGAVVGGIAVLLILGFLVIFCLKRRRRRVDTPEEKSGLNNDDTAPDPFPSIRQFDGSRQAVPRDGLDKSAAGLLSDGSSTPATTEKGQAYRQQQQRLEDEFNMMYHDTSSPLNSTPTLPLIDASPTGNVDHHYWSSSPSATPISSPTFSAEKTSTTAASSQPLLSASHQQQQHNHHPAPAFEMRRINHPQTPPWAPSEQPPQVDRGINSALDAALPVQHDEDSGIRLRQHAATGGFVHVLPPLYTPH